MSDSVGIVTYGFFVDNASGAESYLGSKPFFYKCGQNLQLDFAVYIYEKESSGYSSSKGASLP